MPPTKTAPKKIKKNLKHWEWVELRKSGLSYKAIAKQFGVTPMAVSQGVITALKDYQNETAGEYRQLLTDRLEAKALELERFLKLKSKREAKIKLEAYDRWIKIQQELAKLHGCYVEIKVQTGPQINLGPQTNVVGQQNVLKLDLTKLNDEQLGQYRSLLDAFGKPAEPARPVLDVPALPVQKPNGTGNGEGQGRSGALPA